VLAQQVSVKLFAADPERVDLARFIPIFHRWIQEGRLPGRLLIDVADYRHVADGPGVMLIALESEHGPLGLSVSRKRDDPGELEDKLGEALADALAAARALEGDPEQPIRFAATPVRVTIMSRRFASNTPETLAAARPALEAAAARLHPGRPVTIHQVSPDPRAPFSVELAFAGATGLPESL
jgi:hypothetical protein